MKRKFVCGHVGLGKYCHLCKAVEQGKLIKGEDGKWIQPNVKPVEK